jgi:hypothetical protein
MTLAKTSIGEISKAQRYIKRLIRGKLNLLSKSIILPIKRRRNISPIITDADMYKALSNLKRKRSKAMISIRIKPKIILKAN